jgi:hypothetical protein
MFPKILYNGIPSFFFKYDTHTPFTHCSLCEGSLVHSSLYAIEKVFKHNKVLQTSEIVYEYAICMECATEAGTEISDESRESIQALFAEHAENLSMKVDYLHRTEKYSLESWLERCSFTGKETRLCSEYAVSCLVENGNMVFEHSPMVVSDEFMEKIQQELSLETKKTFDGLLDKIVDGTPSIEDLIFSPTPGLL